MTYKALYSMDPGYAKRLYHSLESSLALKNLWGELSLGPSILIGLSAEDKTEGHFSVASSTLWKAFGSQVGLFSLILPQAGKESLFIQLLIDLGKLGE